MTDTEDKKMTFFIKDDCVKHSSDSGDSEANSFIKLRHPKSQGPAMFMYSPQEKVLCEVVKFSEEHRSWIFGTTVSSDGGVYIVTPVDPLYFLLPYLIKAADGGKFVPLDQIVCDEEFQDAASILSSCTRQENVRNVCQVKGGDDFQAYKYDESLALEWLDKKVRRLDAVLDQEKVDIYGGSVSASFVKSKKVTENTTDDRLRYAYDMVEKYLPEDLSEKLKKHLKIKDPVPLVHEKPSTTEPPAKRAKLAPEEDYSQGAKPDKSKKLTRTTLAQKQLDKVDKSGMKNISSFFSPKPKKPV